MGTRQILQDVASEFANLDPAKLDRFIVYALELMDVSVFGDKAGLAAAYLAGHMLEVDRRKQKNLQGSGRITSQTKHAVGFAPQLLNTNDSDEALRATPYGMQFLSIRNSLAGASSMVITEHS